MDREMDSVILQQQSLRKYDQLNKEKEDKEVLKK